MFSLKTEVGRTPRALGAAEPTTGPRNPSLGVHPSCGAFQKLGLRQKTNTLIEAVSKMAC